MRRGGVLGCLVACLVIASACSSEPEKVQTFPEIQLISQALDGEIVDVGPVLQQDSMLWFWAPW